MILNYEKLEKQTDTNNNKYKKLKSEVNVDD